MRSPITSHYAVPYLYTVPILHVITNNGRWKWLTYGSPCFATLLYPPLATEWKRIDKRRNAVFDFIQTTYLRCQHELVGQSATWAVANWCKHLSGNTRRTQMKTGWYVDVSVTVALRGRRRGQRPTTTRWPLDNEHTNYWRTTDHWITHRPCHQRSTIMVLRKPITSMQTAKVVH